MGSPLNPGDVVDGRYVVERLLGQGGMGAVFVAHEEQLARRVAIKVLLGDGISTDEAIARFEREARAAASLESEHVTRVFSVGRLASGLPFIAMELLDGEDLAHVLARRGPLPALEVALLVAQACDALDEAHARGIVHRDLKPANLFVARRVNGTTTVKVLDFGISKANEPTRQNKALTATSALMGTPTYMSPEQLREVRNVDGRTDVWALGVTMFELLTGMLPFNAEGLAELCVKVLTEPPPLLVSFRRDLPPHLVHLVDRCLRKEPSERPSAAELGAGLRAVAQADGAASSPRLPAPPSLAQSVPAASAMPLPAQHALTPTPGSMPGAFGPPAPHTPHTVDPVARAAMPTSGSSLATFALVAVVGVTALTAGGWLAYRTLTPRAVATPMALPAADAAAAPEPSAARAPNSEVLTPTVPPLPAAPLPSGSVTAREKPPRRAPLPGTSSAPPAPSARSPVASEPPALPTPRTKPSASPTPGTLRGGPLDIPLERR